MSIDVVDLRNFYGQRLGVGGQDLLVGIRARANAHRVSRCGCDVGVTKRRAGSQV